jgi:hypothetical protein
MIRVIIELDCLPSTSGMGRRPADRNQAAPYVFLLPALDPYIMGYQDRQRFLAPERHDKIFDRAGNAMPTAWANGQVVGVWGQRKDGRVVCGLFKPVGDDTLALLTDQARRLESFLEGEFLALSTSTSFTRNLK